MIRTDGLPEDLASDLHDALVDASGWSKATRSGTSGNNCAEVKALPHGYVGPNRLKVATYG